MSVPRVLVTGCAGYLGAIAVPLLLKSGCKVTGVDNLLYGNGQAMLGFLGDPNFDFVKEDVRNWLPVQDLAAKHDVVIPLAAIVGAPACQRHVEHAIDVNDVAVRNLVKSLSAEQRVIYTNTNSGYGQTDGNSFCTEADPLNPVSLYGTTKCAGERAVLEHPNGVSLRLATVFGASPRMRMDLMVNDFTHRLCTAGALSVFDPHYKRNFVHVRDVARAILHAVATPWMRGAYNVGLPSANLTKLELAYAVCDALSLNRERVTVGEGKDEDNRNYLVSNDKLLATDFSFRFGLEEGIREVAWVCATHTEDQLAGMRNV